MPDLQTDRAAALYSQQLQDYIADLSTVKRLDAPNSTITKTSSICGSQLTLDLTFKNDRIDQIGHALAACNLTRATLRSFIRHAPGLTRTDILKAKTALQNWLTEQSDILPEPWDELYIIAAARPYSLRHSAMMLPFDAAMAAYEKLDKSRRI